MTRLYLDHNATTPLRAEARAVLLEHLHAGLGNPSSLHTSGRAARAVVDEARERVARALGVPEEEVVFTSGATEANNLALAGVLEACGAGSGLTTCGTEHSSVLEPARALAARGYPLTLVAVDREGLPRLEDLAQAVATGGIALVSLAVANGETGAAPDLEALNEVLDGAGASRPLFHADAVQALGRIPLTLTSSKLDLASFSAHKLGGPVGVGVLWRRSGTPLQPRTLGGGQEAEVRPGTENVASIAAAAVAIELAVQEQVEYAERTSQLTRLLWGEIESALPEVSIVGPPLGSARRIPNTLCVSVPGTDGRVLVTRLDLEGLEASAGSACASGSIEPSHVLQAMGYEDEQARSGLRLSVGRNTIRDDCKRAARIFEKLFGRPSTSRVHTERCAKRD